MKFIYKHNPLETSILLDENDKKLLLSKLKYERLEEELHHIAYYATNPEKEKLLEESCSRLYAFLSNVNNMDMSHNIFTDAIITLEAGTHLGDCTCFPMSCERCYLERLLNISYLNGMSNKMGNAIQQSFSKFDTIDQVLDDLAKPYDETTPNTWKKQSTTTFKSYFPVWNEIKLKAYNWLSEYKQKHNF